MTSAEAPMELTRHPGKLNLGRTIDAATRWRPGAWNSDPDCHWSWDPNDRIKDATGKPRAPQWVRYGVDLYPQIIDIEPEIMVGADGYPRQFPEEFFQFARDGSRQGVVEIVEDT